MTNLQRRLRKLEGFLTDSSGLVPHTQKWLAHWDRQIYVFMTDQRQGERPRFPLEAFRAVMKYMDDPRSLVGSIPNIRE